MRKLPLLVLSALAFTNICAQRIELPQIKTGSGARLPANFYAPNSVGNSINPVDIQGQFERGEWTRGNVKFKNGQEAKDVMLLFDVHNNKLYFRQGKTTMEFLNPVYEFEIGLLIGPDTAKVLYRSSYPAINYNTAETFYEIVVDGSQMQLLWCRAKNVNLYKDESQPEERRHTEKEQWFVHLPEGKMVKIKRDKNEIVKALPEYADRINLIIKEKGLKVKDPEDFIQLFASLNGL
jgi:hypothetical protein